MRQYHKRLLPAHRLRHSIGDKYRNVAVTSTFFYKKLVVNDCSSVRSWMEKVDLFSRDMFLIPVHTEKHWSVACIDLRGRSIRYYDSMHRRNNECLEKLRKLVEMEAKERMDQHMNFAQWTIKNAGDCPMQTNGFDCGVFVCIMAEHLSRDEQMQFIQHDMQRYRRQLMHEILNKELYN